MREPQLLDYYSKYLQCFDVIDKMNDEYTDLEEKNKELQKEIQFLNKIFEDFRNSAVFNLVRAKTLDGREIWFDRIKPGVDKKFMETHVRDEKIQYLIDNCNPRCER